MYGDFSGSAKNQLHGRGFSLLTYPIEEVSNRELIDIDFVLYGVTDAYGVKNIPKVDNIAKYGVWYLDGHDHSKITKTPCFKRELFESHKNVFPTGFGIPEHRIRPIDFSKKNQIIQRTAPPYACFGPQILGQTARSLYVFTNEEEYYDDMASSWFGLTCLKGGWDSLRHYEILASGSLLLFRDYNQKPKPCAPRDLPCVSYSSPEELKTIIQSLVVDNKPVQEYIDLVNAQREWLLKNGTTKARAKSILDIMDKNS